MERKDFLFSYSKDLTDYLRGKGFRYLTHAVHPKSKMDFHMFFRSPELEKALNEYKGRDGE
jgi:hypothetical protein